MPTATQHEWIKRVLGVKGDLGGDAGPDDDDGIADTAASAVRSAATTYVDFSVGEVQGAAKVIAPMAEQASTAEQYMNPVTAGFKIEEAGTELGEAAYKLGTDEQYRDAAIAKAESIGNTVLGAAAVAAQAGQITTDLMINPVQGAQEVASVAAAGAEKLGQVYDKVSAGYQDAAAKGEGARYVGNIVGQAGAMIGLAVAGAPEAAGGELLAEGATVEAGGLAADGELPGIVEDGATEESAVSDLGSSEGSASAEVAPDDAAVEPANDGAGQPSTEAPQPTAEAGTPSDGITQEAGADTGKPVEDDGTGAATQEGAPAGVATVVDGAPIDDASTVADVEVPDDAMSGEAVADRDADAPQVGAPPAAADAAGTAVADESGGPAAIPDEASVDGARSVDEGDGGRLVSDGAAADGDAGSAADDWDDTTQEGVKPIDYQAVVGDAADKVQAMTDEDLTALSNNDKKQLVRDLTMGGKPSGDTQDALRKVYRSMDLDPTFRVKEDARVRGVADSLAGDDELKEAQDNWDFLEPDERKSALKKVLNAQSEAYGIPPPEIETFDAEPGADGSIENGFFKDGKIHLNTNAKSAFGDFKSSVDLIGHENAHNYQAKLIERLKSGELRPGDDEYEQATMFEVNARNGAYIRADGGVDMQDYVMQPMEQHAWRSGRNLSDAILDAL